MLLYVVGPGEPVAEVLCSNGIATINVDNYREGKRLVEVRITVTQLRDLLRQCERGNAESQAHCDFCGRTESVDDAVEAGWVPCYRSGDTLRERPVCLDCEEKYLLLDEGAVEMRVKYGPR